jgi:hypothetical protein
MDESSVPFGEYVLGALLYLTLFTSQCFWDNPVRFGVQHKIDAYAVRMTVCAFLVYGLTLHMDYIYVAIVSLMTFALFCSDYFSSRNWCGNYHILFHGDLHLIAMLWFFVHFAPK